METDIIDPKLSQKQIAKQIGTSQGTIKTYRNDINTNSR